MVSNNRLEQIDRPAASLSLSLSVSLREDYMATLIRATIIRKQVAENRPTEACCKGDSLLSCSSSLDFYLTTWTPIAHAQNRAQVEGTNALYLSNQICHLWIELTSYIVP